MNISLTILSFIFLIAPGAFLLIASLGYQKWWKEKLDNIGLKTIAENGITLSQIIGSILATTGLFLITIGLFQQQNRGNRHRTHKRVVVELKSLGKNQHIGSGGRLYVNKPVHKKRGKHSRRKMKRIYLE
tara:strand:+ start:353 stop:742 length:390 start_codon:yes stop_codon:yes gene_type:complete